MNRGPWIVALVMALWSPSALADTSNWDLGGKLYTKFLYTNDDSQGCLVWGNPFWPESITGGNGVCTEFEVNLKGKVSRWVEAGVRVKSRYGANWHDWWESGNQNFLVDGKPTHNTSGDTLGMDHAQYMKLRGYFVRIAPPIPTVRWVHVGSSDFSMFNPWTIGKLRYIDRDNGKGLFVEGSLLDSSMRYHVGAVALPKLFAGPGWSTGLGDPMVEYPFLTQDWAYAAKVEYQLLDELSFRLVADFTNDLEVDLADPDASGTLYPECKDELGRPIPGCGRDGGVDMDSRYQSLDATMEFLWDATDLLQIKGMVGHSRQWTNPEHMANGVLTNAGVSPVVFGDTSDWAGILDINWDDPFEIGLSFKFEGFYIGPEWNSIFGARRETDVLLTDGLVEGGQLPTLNIANEFQDWDEPWFESCIGWQGVTGVASYDADQLSVEVEGTVIDYGTNGQNWLVRPRTLYGLDQVALAEERGDPPPEWYPDFLHTDGYTDTDLYDYANVGDRGRDLRSVYRENKERLTLIGVLRTSYAFDVGNGLDLSTKLKFIYDRDDRDEPPDDLSDLSDPLDPDRPEKLFVEDMSEDLRRQWYEADDYRGYILQARARLAYQAETWLRLYAGYQFDRWDERHRSGTRAISTGEGGVQTVSGVGDYLTVKHKPFVGLAFSFGGAQMKYELQLVAKDQEREFDVDQRWRVWRSKASLEVAW